MSFRYERRSTRAGCRGVLTPGKHTREEVEKRGGDLRFGLPGEEDRLAVAPENRDLVGFAVEGDVLARDVVGNEEVRPFALQLGARVALQVVRLGGEPDHDRARGHVPQTGQDV